MNDIEFDIQNRETRTQRGKRARLQRRWKQGMMVLSGLTAFSLTMLVASNLIQPTYSIYTSKAGLKGTFSAKDSFCGRDENEDRHDDRRDLTVVTSQDDKGRDKQGDKKRCKGDKERDDSRTDQTDGKPMIPDGKPVTPDVKPPDPPVQPESPVQSEPQVPDDFRIPPQRNPMSSPSDVPPR